MDTSDNNFVDIYGQDDMINVLSTTASVSDLTEGTIYGFRYRARNIYGWGSWSPITYILAASVPNQPPAVDFTSATDNSISLSLFFTENSNGDLFSEHELWMAPGETDNEDLYA